MIENKKLPLYQCHKQVRALQIKHINTNYDGALISPFEKEYGPFQVDHSYLAKHKPIVGGYYIVYEDGYQSFSPSKAFVEGYTKL